MEIKTITLMLMIIFIALSIISNRIKNNRKIFNLTFSCCVISAIIAGLNFSENTIWYYFIGSVWLLTSLITVETCLKIQEIIDLEEEYNLLKETETDLIKGVFEENTIYYDESKDELTIEPKRFFERIMDKKEN